MATFRFRSNRWQARVRRQGQPEQTRSFLTHKEAERWASDLPPFAIPLISWKSGLRLI